MIPKTSIPHANPTYIPMLDESNMASLTIKFKLPETSQALNIKSAVYYAL